MFGEVTGARRGLTHRSTGLPHLLAAALLGAALYLLVAGVADGSPGARSSARTTVEGERAVEARTSGGLKATIRTTSYGIPHIKAPDYAGLGLGYGYAFAGDNICVIAESYVTVAGERSRFFGANDTYEIAANGTTVTNLNSDFFYKRINDDRVVERLLAKPPPAGPLPAVRQVVRGYVAGYNRYLREAGVDQLSDPRCRGEEWVRPIRAIDVYRRFYQAVLLASSGVAIDGIGGAQPPTPPLGGGRQGLPDARALEELGGRLPLGGLGSNAYGLGREATAGGRGMLLANPHFPWDGSERFYQAQLTIPGEVNVTGASLFGVPLILIGHTRELAWSHTVSTAFRFTPFELTLLPGSPTTYLVDGRPRQMERDRVTVEVRTGGGAVEERSRTLYSTIYGPIFTELLGQPLFPWTSAKAFALRDVNAANFGRFLNHFVETARAQSVEEYDRVERRYQGLPFVNSIAADSGGDTYYADIGAIPNVTDARAERCNTAMGAVTFELLRLPVLDGSRSSCNWGRDPDAIEPGIFGPSSLPSLFRPDYVSNSNDSHWLTNPEEPLTGFDRIIGAEDTPRSLRTRLAIIMIQERLAGSDGRPGDRFSLRQLQDVTLSNRQYAGELFRRDLVRMCEDNPVIVTDEGPIDVRAACPVLAAWNVHDDLGSRGAILFRRFVVRALQAVGGPYEQPYSSADPVHTPRGLDTDNPEVRRALGEAVDELRDSRIPLDAPLGQFQYEPRGTERIPVHGGDAFTETGGLEIGVFNVVEAPFVDGRGFPDVKFGSSFVMATELTEGCPETRSLVTYSQSSDPSSPHFADQTRLFSRKRWVDLPFCEGDIAADPNLEVTELRETDAPERPPRDDGESPTPPDRDGGKSRSGEDRDPRTGQARFVGLGGGGGALDRSGEAGSLPFTGLAAGVVGAVGLMLLGVGIAARRLG